MNLNRAQKIFFGVVGVILIIFLVLFLKFTKTAPEQKREVTLNIWGVLDNSSDLQPTIDDFQAYLSKFPEYAMTQVEVNYQKWRKDEIEDMIVNKMAEGKGPDIFYMHNTWLPKHIGKIYPVPDYIMTAEDYKKTFMKVAADDFVRKDQIYAMPHYIDTLALYYNIEHYQSADLSSSRPSKTWTGIQDEVRTLTIKEPGKANVIRRAGIALGTADITNMQDILYAMFLQYGSQICQDEDCSLINIQGGADPEGAIGLFTGFSSSEQPDFTWTEDLLTDFELYNDVDAFAKGKVSMILGYSDLYDEIAVRTKDSRFDFSVAEFPQSDQSANKGVNIAYADYWAPTVSRTSENPDIAWEFVNFMTSREQLNRYHSLTNRPTSREDLLDLHKTEAIFKVFANQAKYARSIRVYDKSATDTLLKSLISQINNKQISVMSAVNLLQEELQSEAQARRALTSPDDVKTDQE